MKIIKTNIIDIEEEKIDQSKVELADKIIQEVQPLLTESYLSKLSEQKKIKIELSKKAKKIRENKEELKKLFGEYNKEKKINKLLEKISRIISSELIETNENYRREMIILLKVINTLSDTQLDYHLNETTKMINRRLSIVL